MNKVNLESVDWVHKDLGCHPVNGDGDGTSGTRWTAIWTAIWTKKGRGKGCVRLGK